MQKILLPLLSGFLASLFFREAALGVLHAAGLIQTAGFLTAPFAPLALPEFIAHALIGAVVAIPMAWLLRIEPARRAPWLQSMVYGALVLTAARTLVVDPLRGVWPSGSLQGLLAIGAISNALWGFGALVLMRAFMSDDEWENDVAD
jgi:hypothetical protein